MMASGSRSIYSPLPQSLSDSESEKELHMDPLTFRSPSKRNNAHIHFQQPKNHYQKLKTAQSGKRGCRKLTPLRKFTFIFSILCCFIPFVIFLWVLPCSDSNSCPVAVSNWKIKREDVELKGPINLIYSLYKRNFNLAVMFVADQFHIDDSNNGVIAFTGQNGEVSWNFQQEIQPQKLDCSLIDITRNGFKDCLLLDKKGLKAIETVTGELIWHVHSQEESKTIGELDFPIIIPDFNNDGVDDLLMIYKEQRVLLVSGKTGRALKNIPLPCLRASHLKAYSNLVSYCCNNRTECYQLELNELQKKIANDSFQGTLVKLNFSPQDNKQVIFLNGKNIVVDNKGNCPDCNATILFTDVTNITLSSLFYTSAYAMKIEPFSFSYDSSAEDVKKTLNGFILKVWHWQHGQKTEDNILDENHIYHNVTIRPITEQILLFAFNNSRNFFKTVNASVSELNQLCVLAKNGQNCQPDLSNQYDSMLITDLNQDGVQELVSYSSTFIQNESSNDGKRNWKLFSNVTVVHLQEELAKFIDL